MSTKSTRSSGTQHTQRGVNQGVVLVDPKSGLPVDVIYEDGKYKLAVTGSGGGGGGPSSDVNIISSIPLTLKDPVTGDLFKVNPDGSIDVNMESDAADGDNIAIGNTWKKIIDQPNSTTTYIGMASPGTSTSAAAWQIKRISTSGTQTFIEYANGTLAFTNIWNNRVSLTYS